MLIFNLDAADVKIDELLVLRVIRCLFPKAQIVQPKLSFFASKTTVTSGQINVYYRKPDMLP